MKVELKSTHSTHFGATVGTLLLAIGFLALIMILSYVFISGV